MALPFPFAPMKAVLGQLPTGPDADERWAYEIKWDGHRAIVHIDAGRVRVQSAGGHDVSGRWHELASIAASVNAGSAVLDGEIVVLDESGRPSFDLVQRRHGRPGATGPAGAPVGHLVFQAFDVIAIDETVTTSLGYLDRRRLLEQLVEAGPNWAVPEHRVGGGAELVRGTAELGLEGVIAKRTDSSYRSGKRSTDWLKIKHRRTVDLPIGGFTAGTGARSASFGSLLLGRRDDSSTDALRFAGGVGTGFDETALSALTDQLARLISSECPFDPPPPRGVSRTATWVRPELTARVEIAEFTNDGHVRHASFVALA